MFLWTSRGFIQWVWIAIIAAFFVTRPVNGFLLAGQPQHYCLVPSGRQKSTLQTGIATSDFPSSFREFHGRFQLSQQRSNNQNNDGGDDNDSLVKVVDFGIQLFAPTTNNNSFVPPPGYLLIWCGLILWTSWTQVGFTIALYGGSKLLLEQLDLDYQDEDEEQQDDDDDDDALSNNALVDLFCFLASLVLGTILIAPFSAPGAPSSSSLDTLSIAGGSTLALLAVVLIATKNNNTASKIGKYSPEDETEQVNRRLMDLWDDQLQKKSKDDERD